MLLMREERSLQRPTYFGARFSRNDVTPSLASPEAPRDWRLGIVRVPVDQLRLRVHPPGDIVARDGKLLLFVEVKTRREGAKIRPLDAVDASKRALIERGANAAAAILSTTSPSSGGVGGRSGTRAPDRCSRCA